MSNSGSVFRHLAISYAGSLITRQQYVQIRSLLLKKLESKGTVEDEDLENFSKLAESTDVPRTEKSYTSSDWIIIALGIAASAVLGFILYS
jgi:hypothetical protein